MRWESGGGGDIDLYNELFSPDRRGCPLYCDTDVAHAFQKDSFLCVGQLWYWIKPVSSSLATFVDGFSGVGLPTGRFFFRILPDQIEKQFNRFFYPKECENRSRYSRGYFTHLVAWKENDL